MFPFNKSHHEALQIFRSFGLLSPKLVETFRDGDLVKTQIFSQDLAVVSKDGSAKLTGSIEDLRLLASGPNPLTDDLVLEIAGFHPSQIQARAFDQGIGCCGILLEKS